MQLTSEQRVFFLGAGAMSEAIIKGLLTAHILPDQNILVNNRRHAARLEELHERYGVRVCQDRAAGIEQADVLLLAVKPFDLATALQTIAPYVSAEQLVISVVAGASTTTIEEYLGRDVPVIRAMPNTSSFVQVSATAICAGKHATAAHIALAHQLFDAIGISVLVEEQQMNAITGLSGTGPAYIYYVAEALLDAGQTCGLPAETCRELVIQTLLGSAKMLQETGKTPAELRRQVTSPNGTTMAGIGVLEQSNARALFVQAVQRATQRAAELGQEVPTPQHIGAGNVHED